jgi:ABC-type transport system involved in cytochrome bd biosynthesis fused ATPase/permease subunit
VRRVIETLRHNTTLFVVTHRPSHIALADRVLRLHEGQLEELPRPQASAVTGPTAVPIRRAESQPMPRHAAR